MTILIVSCSASKSALDRGPARRIYAGRLLYLALAVGEKKRWQCYILSAKYGIIRPDDVIDNYDQRMKKPYQGPWPTGAGFYVGARLYFEQAPARLRPLVIDPSLSGYHASIENGIGNQLRRLKLMLGAQ